MNTKKELVDRVYALLWEDQTSTVFDKEWEVIPKINDTIKDICRCKITNLITWLDIKWGLLDFLYQEKTLEIPKMKRLLEDIDENSEYMTLDSVDWLPDEWYVEIQWNVIWYERIDGNRLYWLNGVNWPHKAARGVVHFAYVLPDNMIKASDFFDITRDTILKLVDFREDKGCMRCYAIKPFAKDQKVAIFYNIDWPVQITYSEYLEEMEDDEDECGFPENFWIRIIPYIVVWEMLIDTEESNRGKELLQIWYGSLEDMYAFYATPAKQFRKKLRAKWMNPWYLDLDYYM